MSVYNIEAELRLRDLMSAGMMAIASHFTRLERSVKAAQSHVNELTGAFKALGVVVAGGAIFKGLEVLTEHGLRLEHFKTQLEAAGYSTEQVTKAMSAAWSETRNNLNTVVADNLKNIHHLANITGNFDEALMMLPLFNKAENAINSLKDDDAKGHAFASELQTYNYARFMEELGIVSQRPGESHEAAEQRLDSYLNATMKGIVAMRGLVDPGMLYHTVQNTGGTQLQWSQDFIGHELFPLIQTFGSAAGNMSYMLTAMLAQGRMTTASAEALAKYHLVNENDIQYDKNGRAIKVKPGGVKGSDLLKQNWVRWFSEVYLPELAKQGIVTPEQVDAVSDEIFRNKTVARAARYATNPGTRSQLAKERANIDRVPDDAVNQLQAKDPSSVIKRFYTTWENLMTALGHPLVPTALNMLERVTKSMAVIKDIAVGHPEAILAIGKGLAVVAGGLTVLGIALTGGLLLSAVGLMGSGGLLVVGLGTLAAAVVVFWDKIKSAGKAISEWWNGKGESMDKNGGYHAREKGMKDKWTEILNPHDWLPKLLEWTGSLAVKITQGLIDAIGRVDVWAMSEALGRKIQAALDAIPGMMSGWFAPGGGGAGTVYGRGGAAVGQHPLRQNQNFVPDRGSGRPVVIHTALHVDGRKLAEQVSYHQAQGGRHVGSGATFDGTMSPMPVDQSYT